MGRLIEQELCFRRRPDLGKGGHALKFGFMFQEDHYNGYGWHTATGTWNFTRGATSAFLPNGTIDQSSASGNAFASLLLGEVNTADITTNRIISNQWRYYAAMLRMIGA